MVKSATTRKSGQRPYAKPSLTRYLSPEGQVAEYMVATGSKSSAKCTDPGTCKARGRGLFAPPPWGG